MHFLCWDSYAIARRAFIDHHAGRLLYDSRFEGCVSQQIGIVSVSKDHTCVEKLAQLFPHVSAVRLPVRLITTGKKRLEESTVIEFGTAHEVLFASSLPLEFEDHVRLINSDGSFDARATIIAVRYHSGRKAVAARFLGAVQNWIIQP